MAAATTKIILGLLCDNHGCLEFRRLEEMMAQSFTIAPSVLRTVLFDQNIVAIKEGEEESSGALQIRPDSVIVAKTGVRLCKKNAGECDRCEDVHLCRYHVCGDCMFGVKCKNPHSLSVPHNIQVLNEHKLHMLTEKQLFQLLIQNDPFLLPEICPHYNKGDGVHGSCKHAETCNKLHVCKHHFQGSCAFGSNCKRIHQVDEKLMKHFRGVSPENMENLFKIYRNKSIIVEQQKKSAAVEGGAPVPALSQNKPEPLCAGPSKASSQAEKKEICTFFLRKLCNYKEKCVRIHWHLPYKWEVLDRDGVTWKNLNNNERVEEAFSDPANVSSQCAVSERIVDFMTMTRDGAPVRRLSTASSASKPPKYVFTTKWRWYWEDDDEEWLEFGESDDDSPASVTSETLEKAFLQKTLPGIPFSAGNQTYILHFKDAAGTMYQEDTISKTRRAVRRRPFFLPRQDVESLQSASQGAHSLPAANVPLSWDKNFLPSVGYQMVPLLRSAGDFKLMTQLFLSSMSRRKIDSIHRIQNPSQWKLFQRQKEQMKERNGGKLPNEMYLFHGTREELVEGICEKNFDCRKCDGHNTLSGKGRYFAKDASSASTSASSNKAMFACLVLVGDYTKGRRSFEQPPPKDGGRTRYDSCVDSERNPTFFIIFDKLQVYPEYLIRYS